MKSSYAIHLPVFAAGIGLSGLPMGVLTVNAAPSDPPPPCVYCDGGPGGGPATGPSMQGPSMQSPETSGVQPPSGGGPKSGGRAVG